VIPEIIGATGIISKSFRKYLSNISGKHKIKKYRKQPYGALHTCCNMIYPRNMVSGICKYPA
jgi:hypothetical protein